ncbi:MAG: ATP-binding cassette domain-containing protein [Betaproteobacteria bacterium]|nr:ATP-binding cassette domain-containing protein [Betaproteobacteria bacterium]
MKLLEARQLATGWQRPAHHPLSFIVKRGEILALTGPNGAGKSTLLTALAGSGAQIFSGHLRRDPAIRVGFLSQHPPLIEGLPLTGAELLALTGASPDGLPPWLAASLNRRLDKLSGGQKQFLALWSILQASADLLLLDEPGNHLDKAGLALLPSALRARAGQNVGIVLVSHDAKLTQDCCDQLVNVEPCDD